MNKISLVAVSLSLLMLSGCAVFRPDPGEEIIGRWQTNVGGFPVTVEYTEEVVRVGNHPGVPYQLEGDRLTFNQGGSQERIVNFPSGDEMIQTDPMTGTRHRFVREES